MSTHSIVGRLTNWVVNWYRVLKSRPGFKVDYSVILMMTVFHSYEGLMSYLLDKRAAAENIY